MADTTSLVLYDSRIADREVVALAGFLAGYAGRTRGAYALDLRQFVAWCQIRQLRLFDAPRSDIEMYARELEERGKARATIGRRLSTITRFYRYVAEEGLIEHSPAVHVAGPASTTRPTPWASTATARRLPGRRRAVVPPRPRLGVAAGAQRPAHLRGPRR